MPLGAVKDRQTHIINNFILGINVNPDFDLDLSLK